MRTKKRKNYITAKSRITAHFGKSTIDEILMEEGKRERFYSEQSEWMPGNNGKGEKMEGDLISRSALLAEINGEENTRADRLMREWYADMVERQPAIHARTVVSVGGEGRRRGTAGKSRKKKGRRIVMKEVLFRGKRIGDGKWVEGYLVSIGKGAIFGDDKYGIVDKAALVDNAGAKRVYGMVIDEVDPETVGQYVGQQDGNGKKIFEGDICRVYDPIVDKEDGPFKVEWNDDNAMVELGGNGIPENFENVWGYNCEVIGNVYDNPELMEDD